MPVDNHEGKGYRSHLPVTTMTADCALSGGHNLGSLFLPASGALPRDPVESRRPPTPPDLTYFLPPPAQVPDPDPSVLKVPRGTSLWVFSSSTVLGSPVPSGP